VPSQRVFAAIQKYTVEKYNTVQYKRCTLHPLIDVAYEAPRPFEGQEYLCSRHDNRIQTCSVEFVGLLKKLKLM
jgi:hypothetical protein